MSKGFNMSILLGNLGADPRMAYSKSGLPIVNFDMATSERWRNPAGNYEERTEWHRIVGFGSIAEVCGSKLKKGSQVFVTGRKQTREWKDDKGVKKWTVEIVLRDIVFTGPAPEMPKSQTEIPDNTNQPANDDIPF